MEPHNDILTLQTRIRAFAEARAWASFHTPKNLAMALVVEAAELVEPFQWLTPEESRVKMDDPDFRAAVTDEIADVAIYLLRLADVTGVDVGAAVLEKLERNEGRFPRE
jgi:dCTP diphosphatase